jgi:hypothetical protein
MRTKFFTLAFIACTTLLSAQSNQIDVNVLVAPSTPAASLLGITPAEIDKPREPSEFLASVIQNTGSFNKLPGSYAIEISPSWMFAGKKIQHKDFISNELKHNLWQNLTFSAAIQQADLETDLGLVPNTQVAFGMKTSLIRGKGLAPETQRIINRAQAALNNLNVKLSKYLKEDETYQELIEKAIDNPADTAEISAYRAELYAKFEAEEIGKLETLLKDVRYERLGLKMDLSAGVINDYPDNNHDSRRLSKAGVWLNTGYDGKKGLSIVSMVRFLKTPDAIIGTDSVGNISTADLNNFDVGGRMLYAPVNERFTMSAEAIYRNYSDNELYPANWRWVLQAEYKVMPNLSFNFTYGRDYQGIINKNGNVIALVSLFTGLGNAKPVLDQK